MVYAEIYDPDQKRVLNLELKDDGFQNDEYPNDGIYSVKVFFSKNFAEGNYSIKFYALDQYEQIRKLGAHSFKYISKTTNYVPILSNLSLPDSVKINIPFAFSVQVEDSNGLSDIQKVYYELYRPDGSKVANSQGISQFPLFDDGAENSSGDSTANDGIFTVRLTFPSGQPLGNWKFDFSASDRSNKLSNIISKQIVLIQN